MEQATNPALTSPRICKDSLSDCVTDFGRDWLNRRLSAAEIESLASFPLILETDGAKAVFANSADLIALQDALMQNQTDFMYRRSRMVIQPLLLQENDDTATYYHACFVKTGHERNEIRYLQSVKTYVRRQTEGWRIAALSIKSERKTEAPQVDDAASASPL